MKHFDLNRDNKVAAPESEWILGAANFYSSAAVFQWTSKPKLRK